MPNLFDDLFSLIVLLFKDDLFKYVCPSIRHPPIVHFSIGTPLILNAFFSPVAFEPDS